MFRTAILLVTSLVILSACNNETKTNGGTAPLSDTQLTRQPQDTTPGSLPGSDRDEKGCIISAGYRWSVIKDTCIRIFETGIKMEPKDPSLDPSTSAYLVFSNDRVRVEIFLPTQKKAVIIRRMEGSGEPQDWKSGPLLLSFRNGSYSLYDEEKLLYQGK